MKKNPWYFLFLFVPFLLQASFYRVFPGSSLVPQFFIVLVIVVSVNLEFKQALTISFIAGFLAELFSGVSFGTMISAFLLACFIAHALTRKLTSQDISISTAAFLVAVETLAFAVWVWFFNWFASGLNLGSQVTASEIFRLGLVWQTAANLIFFFPINRLFKIFFNE